VSMEWDVKAQGILDGDYELKAWSSCGEVTGNDDFDTFQSAVMPVTIDRRPPMPMHWSPANGVATLGTEIAVWWNEDIDCSFLSPASDVQICEVVPGDRVDCSKMPQFEFMCAGNKMEVMFKTSLNGMPELHKSLAGKVLQVCFEGSDSL
jgi:hypothetical protein